MIKSKERKQVRMDSWSFKLLSRYMKTKAKKQRSTNKKSFKSNRKIKYTSGNIAIIYQLL